MHFITGFILPFFFILGSAVVLHEFGHFIVAKLLGVRVETFSVGFGPRLFGRRWGTTDYRLSLIPLGGYVKLGGDESNAPIEGGGEVNIPDRERFDLRPRWQKFLVMIAGPVMNILTALTIPLIGAMIVGVPPAPLPVVKQIKPNGAAAVAGLKVNDRIVAFNGAENPTWDRIYGDALLSPEQPLPLIVERDNQRVALQIKPTKYKEGTESIGDLDFQPDFSNLPVRVGAVDPNSPAAEAGLQSGDRIVAINGEAAFSREQVSRYIQEHKAEPLRLTIERNGAREEKTAQVRRLADGTERLGIVYGLERVGFTAAAAHAVNRNIEVIRLTGKALSQVFSGRRSARDTLSGPIGIARASSAAASEGWGGIFAMLGFLSLNLGIFNLLPIPVLDGGAIFLLLVEFILGVVGLTLSMAMRERIQQVGFVAIMLLMIFVISNDVLKEVSRMRNTDAKPAVTAPAAEQNK
ncbi:MAG: RIP metalloprotease RseP [Pyrinomonadaceae bacterium]